MNTDRTGEAAVARGATPRRRGRANSTKKNRQWTIKGLPPATVEVTREAAKQCGMQLNSFVNNALERAAAEISSEKSVAKSIPASPDDLQAIKEELARVRARAEQLETTVNSINAALVKLFAKTPSA